MRIEQSDIDCLIEVSVYLKALADSPETDKAAKIYEEWHSRVQKVYILLLQASDKGQLGLERLVKNGIPNDSSATKAIRALCPYTGQN